MKMRTMLSQIYIRYLLWSAKPMNERGYVMRLTHRVLLAVLWPYYRRLPEYLRDHAPWKAFKLLCDNYRHLSEVELPSARKIEGLALKEAMEERKLRIHAETRLLGVDEGTLEHINSVFGTDLPTKRMD